MLFLLIISRLYIYFIKAKFITFREIIDNIKKSNILKDNTIIIIETTKKENFDDLEEIKAKKYGDKYIFIYKIKR